MYIKIKSLIVKSDWWVLMVFACILTTCFMTQHKSCSTSELHGHFFLTFFNTSTIFIYSNSAHTL